MDSMRFTFLFEMIKFLNLELYYKTFFTQDAVHEGHFQHKKAAISGDFPREQKTDLKRLVNPFESTGRKLPIDDGLAQDR